MRGVVCLATWWLQPQAIHGLPPVNKADLKAIKLECWQVKGRAGYHKPELGLASYRQDLCDRLEARYGLRPLVWRPSWWRPLDTDYGLQILDYPFPHPGEVIYPVNKSPLRTALCLVSLDTPHRLACYHAYYTYIDMSTYIHLHTYTNILDMHKYRNIYTRTNINEQTSPPAVWTDFPSL